MPKNEKFLAKKTGIPFTRKMVETKPSDGQSEGFYRLFAVAAARATRAVTISAITVFATIGHVSPPERSRFRELKSIWLARLGRRD